MDAEHDVLLCLCQNLRRAARRTTQFYDRALRSTGLKITQFTLIAAIDRVGSSPLIPLADFLGMERTTLTRNLELLQRQGLVRVREDRGDRRQQMVSLETKGKAALRSAMPKWQKAQKNALAHFPEGGLERLLKDLTTCGKLSESRL